jgi:hypothetical protein
MKLEGHSYSIIDDCHDIQLLLRVREIMMYFKQKDSIDLILVDSININIEALKTNKKLYGAIKTPFFYLYEEEIKDWRYEGT